MKKLCKLYGCNLKHQTDYYDAIVQICDDCGRKVIYNKRDGGYDEMKYAHENRRSYIQPWQKKAWDECYGHTKYGKVLEGKVLDDHKMTDEEKKDEEQYALEMAREAEHINKYL